MKDPKKIIEKLLEEVPAKELGDILIKNIVHSMCDLEIKITKGKDNEIKVDIETDIPEKMEDVKDAAVMSLITNALVCYFADVIVKSGGAYITEDEIREQTDKYFDMVKDDITERVLESVQEKE